MATNVPDEELDDLPDLELLEEARRRGVTFTRSVTRSQIIQAAIQATAQRDEPPPTPLGEWTRDELFAEADARGLEVPKSARKADILAALEEADQAEQQAGEPAAE